MIDDDPTEQDDPTPVPMAMLVALVVFFAGVSVVCFRALLAVLGAGLRANLVTAAGEVLLALVALLAGAVAIALVARRRQLAGRAPRRPGRHAAGPEA